MRLQRSQLLGRDGGARDRVRVRGGDLGVVVCVRRVGELELLRELARRCLGRLGKVEGTLHLLLGARRRAVKVEARGLGDGFEDLDGIALGARPGLLGLAPTLVLGVGGRVALEAVRVHLQHGGAVFAHVVDDGASRLHRVQEVAAVDLDAGHAVVLALLEDVHVGGHVLGEGVDRAPVVNDQEEHRQVLLGRRIQALSHPAVLRAAIADEDDRDAVVTLELLRLEVPVEQDRARRTRRVRQLLRHERPAALEVGLLVIDVHRAARAAARARVLSEELGHDGTSVDSRREGVRVLAVVRVLDVALLERVCNHRRDRLLPVVQVHEAANEPLHVCLVARVLELAAQLHHLVPAHTRTQKTRVTAVDEDVWAEGGGGMTRVLCWAALPPDAGKRPDAALAGAAAPVACSRARRSCMLLRAPRCSGCWWWRRQWLLVVAAAYALSMSPFSIVSYFLRVSSGMPKSSSSLARRLLQSMFGRGRIWPSTTSRCGRIVPAVKSTVSVPPAALRCAGAQRRREESHSPTTARSETAPCANGLTTLVDVGA